MIETVFTEKTIIKKLIIAIVFVFMFNFTFSYLGNNVVFADNAITEENKKNDDKELEQRWRKTTIANTKFNIICS